MLGLNLIKEGRLSCTLQKPWRWFSNVKSTEVSPASAALEDRIKSEVDCHIKHTNLTTILYNRWEFFYLQAALNFLSPQYVIVSEDASCPPQCSTEQKLCSLIDYTTEGILMGAGPAPSPPSDHSPSTNLVSVPFKVLHFMLHSKRHWRGYSIRGQVKLQSVTSLPRCFSSSKPAQT